MYWVYHSSNCLHLIQLKNKMYKISLKMIFAELRTEIYRFKEYYQLTQNLSKIKKPQNNPLSFNNVLDQFIIKLYFCGTLLIGI